MVKFVTYAALPPAPYVQVYTAAQITILQNDISIVHQNYDGKQNIDPVALTQAVGKFYQDQASFGLSAYPIIAYNVSQDIGFDGVVANTNLMNGINWNMQTSLSVKARLAISDMDDIYANNGKPASIAQISAFHIEVYNEFKIDPRHWSGYALAYENLNWIPGATASDLRDVNSQKDVFSSLNPSAYDVAMSIGNLVASGSEGILISAFKSTPLSQDIPTLKSIGVDQEELTKLIYTIIHNNTPSATDVISALESGLNSDGNGGHVQLTETTDGTLIQTASASGNVDVFSDTLGNLEHISATENGQIFVAIYGTNDTSSYSNASIQILPSSTSETIDGDQNIINTTGQTSITINGNNNTFSGVWGDNIYVGDNHTITINSAGNNINLGFNDTLKINQQSSSVFQYGDNDSLFASGTTVWMQNNSVHLTIVGSWITSYDNSPDGGQTLDVWGSSETIHAKGSDIINLDDNSSANLYTDYDQKINISNNVYATLNTSSNVIYSWGTNNTISSSGNTMLMSGNNQDISEVGDWNTVYATNNGSQHVDMLGNNEKFFGDTTTTVSYGNNTSGNITDNGGKIQLSTGSFANVIGEDNNIYASGSNIHVTTSGRNTVYLSNNSSININNLLYVSDGSGNVYFIGTPNNSFGGIYQNGTFNPDIGSYDWSSISDYSNSGYEAEEDPTYSFSGDGDDDGSDPVILNLAGNNIQTIPANVSKQTFDFSDTGHLSATAWIGAGESLLVFKPATQTGELSGANLVPDLNTLSYYDIDHTGSLTAADPIWDQLGLWTKTRADTSVQAADVTSLSSAGISSISLKGSGSDIVQDGTIIGPRATVDLQNGDVGVAADVELRFLHPAVKNDSPPVFDEIKQSKSSIINSTLGDFVNSVTSGKNNGILSSFIPSLVKDQSAVNYYHNEISVSAGSVPVLHQPQAVGLTAFLSPQS